MPQSMQVKPSRVLRLFTLQKHKEKFPPLAGESLFFRDEPPSKYILRTFLKIPPRCCVLLPQGLVQSQLREKDQNIALFPPGDTEDSCHIVLSRKLRLEANLPVILCTGGHIWGVGCRIQTPRTLPCVLLRCSLLSFVFTFCSLSTEHQTNRQESRRCEHKEQASRDPGIQEINILAPMAIDN